VEREDSRWDQGSNLGRASCSSSSPFSSGLRRCSSGSAAQRDLRASARTGERPPTPFGRRATSFRPGGSVPRRGGELALPAARRHGAPACGRGGVPLHLEAPVAAPPARSHSRGCTPLLGWPHAPRRRGASSRTAQCSTLREGASQ